MFGIDHVSHTDPARMPMWAINDIGGTSITNVKHWEQNWKSGRFATMEKNGMPAEDYPVDKLATNLQNTDVMLFVGENDSFC